MRASARLGERIRARFHAVGERLLDQNMDAGLDQLARDVVMERRRHGDAGRIDPADNAAIVGGGLGAELRGDGAGALRVGIDHGDKLARADCAHNDWRGSGRNSRTRPRRCELVLPCRATPDRPAAYSAACATAHFARGERLAHRGDDEVLRVLGEIRMHGQADHALGQPFRLRKPRRRRGHLPVWRQRLSALA